MQLGRPFAARPAPPPVPHLDSRAMSDSPRLRRWFCTDWSQFIYPGPRRAFTADEMARAGNQPWPTGIDQYLYVNLIDGEGVKAIDFGFVAGKWASPFWQVWDLLILWLALIHGANGMRTIVNDYTSPGAVQKVLKGALLLSTIVLLVLGTLVIFTFDPCPAGSPAELLPSFCPAA